MAPDQDPTTQSTLRKLRAFMGFLTNTEELLQSKRFDLAEAYRYALREYDRLDQLEASAAGNDPARRLAWQREQTRVETELFQRFSHGIDFLRKHGPEHPLLPRYLSYRARWRQSLDFEASASLSHAKGHGLSPDAEVFGLALERLLHLHAQLATLEMPHEFAESFMLFLAGLHYSITYQRTHGRPPHHPERDELYALSQQCLDLALEFALQSEPQKLARTFVRLPADTAFHCLFMGIAFLQENLPAAGIDWMQRTRPRENRLRLFFAVGVQAASAPTAQRLLRQIQSQLPRLTSEHMGADLGRVLEMLAEAV